MLSEERLFIIIIDNMEGFSLDLPAGQGRLRGSTYLVDEYEGQSDWRYVYSQNRYVLSQQIKQSVTVFVFVRSANYSKSLKCII